MASQFPFSSIQLLDTPLSRDNQLASFGLTNALLDVTATTNEALLHFWTLPPTLILGLKDKRLPNLRQALQTVTNNGYGYFLRNSGGLAVVSDGGILNVSLFLPQTTDHLAVDDAYGLMQQLLAGAFTPLKIEAYEITHSYCPGDFDLSVNGLKFAGISQRRTPNGLVIMAYISITGDQLFRGEMVHDFYQAGLGDHANEWDFPDVWPQSMANVATLQNRTMDLDDAKAAIQSSLKNQDVTIDTTSLVRLTETQDFKVKYQNELQRMVKRQQVL